MGTMTPSSTQSEDDQDIPKTPEDRLMVAIRVRPLKSDEKERALHVINSKTVNLIEDAASNSQRPVRTGGSSNGGVGRSFTFDVAFGEDVQQDRVYAVTTKRLVEDVVRGYSVAVFAYGATGAGKTHTMVGTARDPGVMARALDDLFEAVRVDETPENYTVRMSCLEIYNEQIKDLLNPSSGFLELREDSKGRNIQVAGLTEIETKSTTQVMQLLDKANKARTVEPTAMNKTSSRSHALVTVQVRYETQSGTGTRVRSGRLVMVDLAGSERANKTKNRGKRLLEGAHINRSLLALANCINALSDKARYVNYRDSKLTRLLKDTLSGNCRAVMIAHVSPAANQKDESRNTLLYAERAKKIQTKAETNVVEVGYQVSQYQTVISELRNEISRLRHKITEERPRSAKVAEMTPAQQNGAVRNLREQIVATFKEQMRLRRKLMEIDSQLLGLGMDAERQHMIISNWESRNNKLYKNNRRPYTQQNRRKTGDSTASSQIDGEIFMSEIEIEGEAAVSQAWAELAEIEREQERWSEERGKTELELDVVRKHGAALENELPDRIGTDDERELLALLCRVHELEADKMALQGERIARTHELRRRDAALLRAERQRHLSDAIITRQRQIMEESKLSLPPDLAELYHLYQQEIHSATYADINFGSFGSMDKLQDIDRDSLFSQRRSAGSNGSGAPSSAESDYGMSPLPPLSESVVNDSPVDRLMGQLVAPPSRGNRFPPLFTAGSLPSRSSRVPSNHSGMKRSSSDINMVTIHDN